MEEGFMTHKWLSGSLALSLVIGGALALLWITTAYQNQDMAMEHATSWLQYP
jgi:hypothetical protein